MDNGRHPLCSSCRQVNAYLYSNSIMLLMSLLGVHACTEQSLVIYTRYANNRLHKVVLAVAAFMFHHGAWRCP